ncbi:MAG: 4-hydroxythreonine-4-phosphate dehydrogenase PdxA [Candidatus Pelagibacter sp.]
MITKKILIVLGEPNSTFSEILSKYFKSKIFKQNKNIIILIGNKNLFEKQIKQLKYSLKINEINDTQNASIKKINIININYKFRKPFTEISQNSNTYIKNCFDLGLKLIIEKKADALINGPISKKHFLKKKFPGVTEYIANRTNSKEPVMLIYNENLAVSPLTTHVPLKNVARHIKKKKIINNILKIHNFYQKRLGKNPNIAVLGLNPHCETTSKKISEERKEIIPAIKFLKKKKIKVDGPIAADTFFLKKNLKKFSVVLGMYHDQVLTPAKTLFEFEAINITIGLPFIKITPDHGPNYEMIGQNKSDPSSIFYALNFLNKVK